MLNIQENIELAYYTTFKIGGRARYFVEVGNKNELKEALEYALKNKLDFFVLGGGSNILISDKGFDGLIIKLGTKNELKIIENNLIECFAGENLSSVVNFSRDNSLSGLEWAIGIPGTMGGAVRGNARAFGKDMATVIENVETFDISEMKIKIFDDIQCGFNYEGSIFKKNKNLIILSAKIKLQVGDKEKIQKEIKEIIEKRISVQPQGFSSAGSFFLNPVVTDEKLRQEFEKETGAKCKNDKVPAGWLIDQAGLRGKKIGGAAVSEKHANFIVNVGNATAEDVIMLASIIKQKVRTKFGVQLVEEVKLLGF